MRVEQWYCDWCKSPIERESLLVVQLPHPGKLEVCRICFDKAVKAIKDIHDPI